MDNSYSAILEFEFNMQANAVARVLTLVGEDKYSLDDVTRLLADAERNAPFFCGFVSLDEDVLFKAGLETRLIERGVVVKDKDGKLSLTAEGRKRSSVQLPQPIELNLAI